MRKSNGRTQHYRPDTRSHGEKVTTFGRQMTDFARGELFRQLREARHLSQEAAGQQMGFTGKTVRGWEQGKPIKWSNAKRVARFYGVTPEEIVTRSVDDDAERLRRIERKLDQLLTHLQVQEAEEALDRQAADSGRSRSSKAHASR